MERRRLLLILAFLAFLAPATPAREHTMTDPLRVSLTLEQTEIVRGESAYFSVVVENVSTQALDEVKTLNMHNRVLRLEAVSADGRFTAEERDILTREGNYAHGPRAAPTISLPPRGKLERRDDTLTWFGELPPGQYKVTATFSGYGEPVTSPAAPLKILPAQPVVLQTPRYGARLGSGPLAAAWTHRTPAGAHLLFYQHQSQSLPRSPRHGVRVAQVADPVQPLAATVATPATELAWLVWSDSRQRLMVARTNIAKPAVSEPVAIKTPFPGVPRASPLAHSDGRLFVPFADPAGKRAALLAIGEDGAAAVVELPVGAAGTLGPSVWLWGWEARLDAAWSRPDGREILASRLPLQDLQGGFSTPVSITVDDPVIWLDGYFDEDAARARHAGEGEPPPPDAVLWAVLRRAKSLALARINLTTRLVQVEWSLPVGDDGPYEPVCSAVTKTGSLSLLLRTARGRLLFVSGASRSVAPLEQAAGRDIAPDQSPALIAAGGDAIRPWVYVRYIERSRDRISYVKLEPADERDPMDPRPPEPQAPIEEPPQE